MKNITLNIQKTFLLLSFILFLNTSLFAVSHSCNGTLATPIHGATNDQSYTDTVNSAGGGGYSGYYRFRPQVDGSVNIKIDGMDNKRQRIYIGSNGCGTSNIYQSNDFRPGIDEHFYVSANQWYYIRIRERNNQNRIHYTIQIDFTDTQGNACNNAINVGLNQDIHTRLKHPGTWNGSPLRYTMYSFTAPSDGSVRIHSTSSPADIYLELEDVNCNYIDYDWGNPVDLNNIIVTAGTTYKLYIDTDGNTPIDITYRIDFTDTSNNHPTANAGADQTINLGDTTTLSGSGTDTDGSIASYRWSEGGTILATTAVFNYTPSSTGDHTLRLTVTDNLGATGSDTVIIHVDGPPIADAGTDQSEEQGTAITLDGSGSSAALGGSLSYLWTENATQLSTNVSFTKNDFTIGTHTLTLTVTDNNGATATDTVVIEITPRTCTLTDSDTLSLSSPVHPIYNRYDNDGTDWNVRDPNYGITERFFQFNIAEAGEVEVTLSDIDDDQARFTISRSPCPYTNSGLKNTSETFTGAGTLYVRVYFYDLPSTHNSIEYRLKVKLTAPIVAVATPDSISVGYNTPFSGNVLNNDIGPGIQVNTGTITNPPHGTVSMQTNGDFVYTPDNNYHGPDSFNYTIQDSNGNTSTTTVDITVANARNAEANDDIYQTQVNVFISGNVFANDYGDGITITSHTTPANQTFTLDSNGNFAFKPVTGSGTDVTFSYTITDRYGNNSTAIVTIQIDDSTDYQNGLQDFVLINPQYTRNILGNFATLGNTVECITNKRGTSSESNSYSGTCQNSTAYNDNNYMSKYIDIDGNSGIGSNTWNSSSSNFTLPDTYNQDNGQGILWAGLFWQGAINNDKSYKQRRASISGGNISYKYITVDEDLDIPTSAANKVLLRIDTENSYSSVQAHTLYYDTAFGDRGGFYAAYSDVTAYLQNKNLEAGSHTITIANITANEGRQSSTGNYAGWSLIIIYKENPLPGVKARNISIYNGYTTISNDAGVRSVHISGFKLPSTGDIVAQFSAFAGEGEYVYGHQSDKFDRMFISKNADLSSSSGMPGATDQDNIFDAILANIDRTAGNNNKMTGNNNGIDIENYDVSTIMTGYRNNDVNISDVYIGLESNQDYVTPSMMAFSADLYKPRICYDYTVQRNGFDITDNNRTVKTRGGGELSINIAIESFEGDFDLENTQISVNLTPKNGTNFTEAFYAPNNVNTFIPAIYIDDNTSRPLIALGQDIDYTGGTITKDQRYFSKFLFDLSAAYNGKFDVTLVSTINYGSGDVPSVQSTKYNEIERCPQSDVYNPTAGILNVERTDSGDYNPVTEPNNRFPLYTQVVGKDFDFHVVAYDANATPAFSEELQLSGYTFDLELINAGPFNDDKAVFICNNPDSSIIKELAPDVNHTFVNFPSGLTTPQSRVDLSALEIQTKTALRNAAFRLWYLVDQNNTLIQHECNLAANPEVCFENIYSTYIEERDTTLQADGTRGYCGTASRAKACVNGGNDCYQCLRNFHAKVICSRDNFAIRPASYRIRISDNNQSTDTNSTIQLLGQNDSTSSVATLSAGYQYKIDARTTSFAVDAVTSEPLTADGYLMDFTKPSNADIISTLKYDTTLNNNKCIDKNDTDWEVHFENGLLNGTDASNQLVKHSNVGEYQYHIEDHNWTLVDQSRFGLKKTFPGVNDCIPDDSTIGGGSVKSGCNTTSILTSNGITYDDLHLTYRPYAFDLSDVHLVKHPDDARPFVYLNDFDNLYYSDLLMHPVDMSVSFEGNITAKGEDNITLTNFTDSCAADDIKLQLHRTTSPIETLLYDTKGNLVELQQYLQHTLRSNPFVDQQTGVDKNLTLPKAAFSDNTNHGKAFMLLHTTFKKPLNALLDPFQIRYEDLNASSTLLSSSADMTTHIPDGNNTYDQNVTYLFAKVTPKKVLYEGVTASTKTTPIFVDIYCTYGTDCNTTYGLNGGLSKGDDETTGEWYYASIFDNTVDGTTDLTAMTDDGTYAGPTVTPNDDVAFTSDTASRNDIEVAVTGAARPSIVGIDIEPVPWLLYDATNLSGFPHYQVEFIDNSGWSGIGNTGKVVETRSSSETSPRMNW